MAQEREPLAAPAAAERRRQCGGQGRLVRGRAAVDGQDRAQVPDVGGVPHLGRRDLPLRDQARAGGVQEVYRVRQGVPARHHRYATRSMENLCSASLLSFPVEVGKRSIFLAFSAPILIIAVLAYVYISFLPSDHVEKKKLRSLSFRLWTYPVLVDGPFGVVSAVEFIGIVLFIVYVVYSMTYYAVETVSLVSEFHMPSSFESDLILEVIGLRLGSVGLFCMLFLFLPAARGSILLRLIDIPFEHATRYHVWLGHLTMALFTLHGLFYVIAWSMQGRLLEKMVEWKQIGVANLPGVISVAAGLLMWVTSLHPVRKRFFELFFYTHQLYVIFVVFLALHVGDFGPVWMFCSLVWLGKAGLASAGERFRLSSSVKQIP